MCESDFPRETQQDAYIVMFDAADFQSFMFARACISQIRQEGQNVPIVFCRTQIDKRFKDIRGLVNAMQTFSLVTECTMFDVSAKSNYNFEKPFLAIMRMVSNNPTLRLKEEGVIDEFAEALATFAANMPFPDNDELVENEGDEE